MGKSHDFPFGIMDVAELLFADTPPVCERLLRGLPYLRGQARQNEPQHGTGFLALQLMRRTRRDAEFIQQSQQCQ